MEKIDNVLYRYKNGNTDVTILKDGTKVREFEDIPIIEHPESMDVKITNYCDLGCGYCHENSTTAGRHADINKLIQVLDEANMPKGVEFAIGGGNPLSHPNIVTLLVRLKDRGFIPNITVNQGHLKQYLPLLIDLISNKSVYGIGVSITDETDITLIKALQEYSPNVVLHVIAGVNTINFINRAHKELKYVKVLVLGYKDFGRGIKYRTNQVTENLNIWHKYIQTYLYKVHLSFDNLAIEQLDIKKLLSPKQWENFYMGDDFTYTMYIDAVNQEFAPTSRSSDRISFRDIGLRDYFIKHKKDVTDTKQNRI